MVYRRFVALKENMSDFERLCNEKGLNRDDLTLILLSLDLNYTVFPEIEDLRKVHQKSEYQK